MKARPAPVLILGVRRSGTTLLRTMLDRHSELAVPDESYFVPQLADRHPRRIDPPKFLDDVRRLPTLAAWGIALDDVRDRLTPGMPVGEAIAVLYELYAQRHGKHRWGDKTPMYMQHLPLLERLFPNALYVHLIRDGRDAATSFLAMPRGIVTETWAHPRSIRGFACQWRTEVLAARKLGGRVGAGRCLEVRYEELVADPARELRRICEFAGLPFEPQMLDYSAAADLSPAPHQANLRKPPTPGLRDWRRELSAHDVASFESVAGDVLRDLDYEVVTPASESLPDARGRLELLSYRGRVSAWRVASFSLRRSPLWRRSHPVLA